jgi:hypothetical protein
MNEETEEEFDEEFEEYLQALNHPPECRCEYCLTWIWETNFCHFVS